MKKEIEEKLKEKQNNFLNEIKNIISLFKNQKNIFDTQIAIYNLVTAILEEKNLFKYLLIDLNKKLTELKYKEFIEIKTNFDINLKNSNEYNIVISEKIKDMNYDIGIIENYIQFLSDLIVLLKDILYGIKNHIELIKLETI